MMEEGHYAYFKLKETDPDRREFTQGEKSTMTKFMG